MPQAIAAAAVSALGLTGTAALVVGSIIQLAVSWGINAVFQSLFGPKPPSPSDIQQVVRLAVGSRVRHYGEVHTGGQMVFWESKDGTLHQVVVTSHGEISEILEYRLNNNVVTLNGSGVVQEEQYRNKITLQSRLGTDTQTAFSDLTTYFSDWTSAHRLLGCSALYMRCAPASSDVFGDIYEGSREPTATIVAKTTKVYDPRLDSTQTGGSGTHRVDDPDTWEYSNNAALVIADYVAHEDGFGLGYDAINWDNIMTEADESDTSITTVDSRVIAKWRISGSYRLAEAERKSVLGEMLRACDGFMWQDASGLVNLQTGRWVAPTVHINDDHIVSLTASVGGDPQSSTNEVRIVYTDPRLSYTETECAPVVDTVAQAAVGQEVSRFDIYYCPDHNQAVRLGKRKLTQLSERWNITMVLNLYGLNIVGERFIYVTSDELALSQVAFEVTSLKFDITSGLIEVGLVEVRSTDFSFDSASEEGSPPTLPADTKVASSVPVPTGLTLSATSTPAGLGISGSWAENLSRPDLTVEAQYRETSISSWLPVSVQQQERIILVDSVTTSVEYGVRIRYVTITGVASEWSSEVKITPTTAETPPATPTGHSAAFSAGVVTIDWTNPSDSNFSYVDIYRSTTNDISTAATVGGDQTGAPSAAGQYTESPTADTYYYWLVSRSASGLSSAPTTSMSVTVT